VTAMLTVFCNGPDCQDTVKFAPHADGDFDVPAEGWLHVGGSGLGTTWHGDYCGWNCYAADVMRRVMDGGDRD
jgi:hypothetical protein